MYQADETTPVAGTPAIRMSVAGGASSTVNLSSGTFSFTNVTQPTAGQVVTLWMDTANSTNATLVFKYGTTCAGGTTDCTGLSLYQNSIIIGPDYNNTANTIATTDLATCDNDSGAGCADTDIGFTANAGALALTWASNQIRITDANAQFAPGGSVTARGLNESSGSFTGGSGAVTINGDLTLAGGAFTSTSGTLSVSGNWTSNTGSPTFSDNGGTVSLTGNNSITAGSIVFNNVTFTGSYGFAKTITGTMYIKGNLNSTNMSSVTGGGIEFTGSANQVLSPGFDSAHYLTMNGANVINKSGGSITLAQDTWFSSLTITALPGGLDLAGYYLYITSTLLNNANPTVASTGTIVFPNICSITPGTSIWPNVSFNGVYGHTTTITGTLYYQGNMTANNNSYVTGGAIELDGTGSPTINIGSGAYYLTIQNPFTVNKASGTVTLANPIISTSTLTITSGTLDMGASYGLTTGGTLTVGASGILQSTGSGALTLGGNVANSGTISLNGNGTTCGDAKITIASTNTTVRSWSGGGIFTIKDAALSYQNAAVAITVTNGTNGTGNTGSWTWGSCPFATIYRSVGPSATTSLATGAGNAMSIAATTATFASALPDNIGVGDAILYDSDNNGSIDAIAFIAGRTDSTHYTVQSVTGATPTATSAGDTDWRIYRAYTSLANAEAGIENTGITTFVGSAVSPLANFDDWTAGGDATTDDVGKDIVAANLQWNIAAYANGTTADASVVTIAGWTTGASNYIRIYTPTSTTEVGTTQRHNGKWNTSRYRLEVNDTVWAYAPLRSNPSYVRIDGLQILGASANNSSLSGIWLDNPSGCRVSNSILKAGSTTYKAVGIREYAYTTGLLTWNNIVMGFDIGLVLSGSNSGVMSYAYNNTFYACPTGIQATNAGLKVVKNNLIKGSATAAATGTFAAGTDYNSTDNASMGYTVTGGGNTHDRLSQTFTFANEATGDLHLAGDDAGARNVGVDLSGDPYLSFSTDLEGDTRPQFTIWDIGADETTYLPGRYWVGGGSSTSWNATGPTNWSATSGGANNASVPTATDNVYFDTNSGSGNSVLSADISVKSLDMTGYTGTLTHNSATTLTIAGSGVNFKLVSGMTYTLGNAATSALSFTGTSGTTLITTAGKTVGNTTFNGVGGAWQLQDNLTATGGTITFTNGTLDTNSKTVAALAFATDYGNARTLTLGSSSLTFSSPGSSPYAFLANPTNLTMTANTATMTLSGAGAYFRANSGGYTKDWNGLSVIYNGGGTSYININSTFKDFTVTGTASKTDALNLGDGSGSTSGNVTATGTFTVNGNSATNRVLVYGATLGTAATITAANTSFSNVDFQDVTGAGAGNWNLSAITGNSGDSGGNSGITFTTPATQTWSGTSGGNWSTNAWTSRVPLPQDDVVISSAFSGGQTITMDMPRAGHNINFTGTTGNPALSLGTQVYMYGSMTLVAAMNPTSGGYTIHLQGRAAGMPVGGWTWTSAGTTWGKTIAVEAFGGTYKLTDALIISSTNSLSLGYGTFNANNFPVSTGAVGLGSFGNVRALTMGSGTWTLTGTGNVWTAASTNALTFDAGTSTILINDASATAKTFAGLGLTFNNITFTGDNITVTGSNTLNTMAVNNAGRANGLIITSGTTQIVSGFTTNGSSGNLAKISASTPGSAATLSKASGTVSVDWMSIQDSAAAGGATWYAGGNSTNVSGNSGWLFSYAPIRYWVGGTATWDATAGTKWAACSGCGGGAPAPTLTDDVYFDANSGSGTVTSGVGASVKNLDFTGFTGTLAGGCYSYYVYGNLALGAGMTNSSCSGFIFSATSGTKTITTNGVAIRGGVTFNGAGGTFQLADDLTIAANLTALTLTLTAGTFDANGKTVTLTHGGADINGSFTFYNLTRTGVAGNKSTQLKLYKDITVTNNLTLSGNSVTERLFITSDTIGAARTITAANVSAANADFRDITGAGAGSWNLSAITGLSGDAGGNTGITFTTPAMQYWYTTTTGSKNWSTAGNWFLGSGGTGGAGRVPLPQDDARFNASSIGAASTTVNADMPRLGKSIDWTGVTNTPAFTLATYDYSIFGSLTLPAAMTFNSPNNGYDIAFEGRSSYTLTHSGLWPSNRGFDLRAPGGTLTLQEDLTLSSSYALTVYNGTFDANNHNVTCGMVVTNSGYTRGINMGSGTWTINGFHGSQYYSWTAGNGTNLTLNAGTSTLKITDSSATNKYFIGGGKTYNNVVYSGDNIIVQGSNTFNVLSANVAGRANGLIFTSGTTQIVSGFTTNGSSGNLAKISASTPGSAATLSKASGTVSVDWMSIQDSAATGGATWYAGGNSTNVSGNSGWLFSYAPVRYWRGGGPSTNWDATGPTNWGACSTCGNNAPVPAATDDVYFDGNSGSGTSTVNVASSVKNFDLTGFTGTLAGGGALSIYGSLTMGAGMTRTYTGAISMLATSGTQIITSNSKTFAGDITFNGAGAIFRLADNYTTTGSLTLTAGTFDATTNNTTVTLNDTGNQRSVNGAFTFYNLTRNGQTGTGAALLVQQNITVTNTLTLTGNSAVMRLIVRGGDGLGGTGETNRTITAANLVASNVDFRNITGAGAANWNVSAITTVGDAGGNVGLTFTASQPNYWVNGTGNWSDVSHWANSPGGTGGTGRVPLAHDDATFDGSSFSGAQTVTIDVLRLGRNVSFANVGSTPTLAMGATNFSVFGSLTLSNILTVTSGTATTYFEGIGSYGFTNAGVWPAANIRTISINACSGSLTLQDALTMSPAATLRVFTGTFDLNNKNLTVGSFTSTQYAGVRTINLGSSLITITGPDNTAGSGTEAVRLYNTPNLTINAGTSTFKFTDTSATAKSFFGKNGTTFYNIWFTGAGTGNFIISNTNTFNNIKVDTPPHNLKFGAGTTTTVTTFTVAGTAGNLISISSNGAGIHSLVKSGGGIISTDYLSISDSQASPANTWYAGARSTNATPGTNTGWIFAYPPIRYWVGGGSSTSWNATGPTNWAVCSGCANDVPAPTSSDDVFFDANSGSGNSVISADISVKSLDMTGYTGTLTHNAATTLTMAGNGGVFKLASGMTYTLGDAATSALAFTGTSGTTLITTNGKTLGNVTFGSGAGGGWTLQDAFNMGSTAVLTLTSGTLNTNNQAVTMGRFLSTSNNTRTLTLGSSSLTVNGAGGWSLYGSNLTFNANTSTITFNGVGAGFDAQSSLTYNNLIFNRGVVFAYQSLNVNNLTILSGASKTDVASMENMTVTGTLTLGGNSATNRLLLTGYNQGLGVQITITNNGSNVVSNADFRDIKGAGSASWDLSAAPGGAGDCGGNTGIIFSTGTTNYWVGNTGNWSDSTKWANSSGGSGGTGRVPLPQDNVVFDNGSFNNTSQTVTLDMPRAGKSIDWSAYNEGQTPTWSSTGTETFYGSMTLNSGMTMSSNANWTDEGRGAFTFTCAGKAFTSGFLSISMLGGSMTLQDNFSLSTGGANGTLIVGYGTFNANNFNVTMSRFTANITATRTITMGSGTWTVTTGSWNLSNTAGLTINANTSTIIMSDTSATAKTFAGAGFIYNNITFSGDNITITGSNTFNTMAVNNAGLPNGLIFTSGTTQTVSGFTTNGYTGNRAKISASTAGSAATLSKASGTVTVDWMSIKDSAATGGATWYAGYHSDSVSGNSGWIFPGRNWVGGTATWDATAGTKWATCTGCTPGSPVPTAAEDVFFDSGSGTSTTVTLSNASVGRSLNMSGWSSSNTLIHPAATTLTIGDATAGNGNVALDFSDGTWSYILGDPQTSAISFVSTSPTVQTVNFHSEVAGNVTFNGAGASWQLTGTFSSGATAALTFSNGTLDTNGQSVTFGVFNSTSGVRTLTLGSSALTSLNNTNSWTTQNVGSMTVTANTATLTLPGVFLSDQKDFNGLSLVYSGGTTPALNSAVSTFANITYTGSNAKTNALSLNAGVIVTGAFTVNGNSTVNRVFVNGSPLATAQTITAATVSVSNADFRDITGAGAGSWNLSAIIGKSGDSGGNSGITFTSPQTDYWVGGTGNWSNVNKWADSTGGTAGSGRVPLPQDDVRFDGGSFLAGGQTVTLDMPRSGKSIDWTGATNSPTWGRGTNDTNYGSITLIPGMTLANGGYIHTFEGRGPFTLTSAGLTWNQSIFMYMVGGSLTLQDDFNSTFGFNHGAGIFDANNHNFTAPGYNTNLGVLDRTLTMGSGTWTLTGTGSVWYMLTGAIPILNSDTSTIVITDTTAVVKTFRGGSRTYNNITFTGDNINVRGSNTFNNFAVNDAGLPNGINLANGTTQTLNGNFTDNGSSDNSMVIMTSMTGGITATISKASGTVNADYMILQDSTATGGATWYAGDHSINVANNNGWIFTSPSYIHPFDGLLIGGD